MLIEEEGEQEERGKEGKIVVVYQGSSIGTTPPPR